MVINLNSLPPVKLTVLQRCLCASLSPQNGKFGGASPEGRESPPQGLQYAEDAAEHENMKAVLKSSLQGGGDSGSSTVPGLRTRTRANRGQCCHPLHTTPATKPAALRVQFFFRLNSPTVPVKRFDTFSHYVWLY